MGGESLLFIFIYNFLSVCEKNYLHEVVFSTLEVGDDKFLKDAYQEMWVRILLEWPKLDSVRKVFTYLNGSVELDLIHQTLSRVIRWMKLLVAFGFRHSLFATGISGSRLGQCRK